MADRITELSEDRERWAKTLDRQDARLTKIIAANEWPQKNISNWLSTVGVRKAMTDHKTARTIYHGVSHHLWMLEQDEMDARRVSLTQVWQHWRNVLAAREEVKRIGSVDCNLDPVIDHDWRWLLDLNAKIATTQTRERIDAMTAVDRAEGLYDLVLRAYEGRPKRTWEQTLYNLKVSPPKRPLPSPNGKRKLPTRSTYIGAQHVE